MGTIRTRPCLIQTMELKNSGSMDSMSFMVSFLFNILQVKTISAIIPVFGSALIWPYPHEKTVPDPDSVLKMFLFESKILNSDSPRSGSKSTNSNPNARGAMRACISSVADLGCLYRIQDPTFSIPDPNFFHSGSRIRIQEFKYFNPKKLFLSSPEI